MGNIFVSYSRRDSGFVDRLMRDLQERGYQIWVDRADIVGGDVWRASISDSIRDCKAFLLVLSPRSVQSQHVVTELELANQHGRPVVPVLYRQPGIPQRIDYLLGGVQYIDLAQIPYHEALDRLDRKLRKLPSLSSNRHRAKASSLLGPGLRSRLQRPARVSGGSSKRKWVIIAVIVVCVALIVVICLCSSLFGSLSY